MSAELPHDRWLSPFSFRYGSSAMRHIWSEHHKRVCWRRLWAALASAQAEMGLIASEDAREVARHIEAIDIPAAEAIEAEIKHDLMAELTVFASRCGDAGGILHLGATSMDIEDNTDAIRLKSSLALIRQNLHALIETLADLAERYADHATMGFTHLQPAEPTTVGYRIAQWTQDLLLDAEHLAIVSDGIKGKGLKGATGTAASYVELLGSPESAVALEALFLEKLDLDAFDVATQTYPRKQDFRVVSALADLGQSLYRAAFDIRLLQSPVIGELAEPFGFMQVGSSAMPFKRNPIAAENIDSLARQLAAMPRIAWDNAAHSHLERTLDDSANRRSLLPESFLIADAILSRARGIFEGLEVKAAASPRLLARYGPFAATERVMMAAVKAGANRQTIHERLRVHAIAAWSRLEDGQDPQLQSDITSDREITSYLDADAITELLDASRHIGDAAERTRAFVQKARATLAHLEGTATWSTPS